MNAMDFSNVIILLSRQRSGTHALRSVLKLHPDIYAFPEVFDNRMQADWNLVAEHATFPAADTTYFSFLERYCRDRTRAHFAAEDDRHTFEQYLEYLRCFTDKRFLLLDIKYKSVHHVRTAWRFMCEEPFLFGLIRRLGIRVLNLTRPNLLRYYLSDERAKRAQRWHQFDESIVNVGRLPSSCKQEGAPPREDERLRLDVADMMKTLRLCAAEDAIVRESFAGYDRALAVGYEETFPTIGAPVSDEVLRRIAGWLGIAPRFPQTRPEYKKMSSLPLESAIENYDEVAQALKGTEFDACLTDEAMYGPQSSPRSKERKRERRTIPA